MKSVLLSIKPKYCELITNGKKTVEVRKTKPNLKTPFKCYIYETKSNGGIGKVIGEFVCEKVDRITKRGVHNNFNYCYLSLNEWGNDDIEIEITDIKKSCILKKELNSYGEHSPCLFAWHISKLITYNKPIELYKFEKACNHDCAFCKFYHGGGMYEPPSCEWEDFELTRPPQSWCYVEEVESK